jgi:hypothetical protein
MICLIDLCDPDNRTIYFKDYKYVAGRYELQSGGANGHFAYVGSANNHDWIIWAFTQWQEYLDYV